MPGLDDFYKFIEKKEQTGRPQTEEAPAPAKRNANGASRVRYVLRGGITVAEPVSGDEAEEGSPLDGEIAASALGNGANGTHPTLPDAEQTASEEALAMWRRLPRHIQLLATISEPDGEEVARKYYTRDFKETRQQLIQRLLNPTLTLEETARVLGVCPATVRRYTNRGVLPHHRTVGQQRRFRLSDVLVFLQRQEQQASSGRRGSRREGRREAEDAEISPSEAAV